jgi:hypothetical protein
MGSEQGERKERLFLERGDRVPGGGAPRFFVGRCIVKVKMRCAGTLSPRHGRHYLDRA